MKISRAQKIVDTIDGSEFTDPKKKDGLLNALITAINQDTDEEEAILDSEGRKDPG